LPAVPFPARPPVTSVLWEIHKPHYTAM
jgi:hypothetical protein